MSKGHKRVIEHTDIPATANERPVRIDLKPKQIILCSLSLEKVKSEFGGNLLSRKGRSEGPQDLWFSVKSDSSYVADPGILLNSSRTWLAALSAQSDLVLGIRDALVAQNRTTVALAIVDMRPHQTMRVPVEAGPFCELWRQSLNQGLRSLTVTCCDLNKKQHVEFSDDVEVLENRRTVYARWMTVSDRRARIDISKEYVRGSVAGWFPILKSKQKAHCYWESYQGLFEQVVGWLLPTCEQIGMRHSRERWIFLVLDWFVQPVSTDLQVSANLAKRLVTRVSQVDFAVRYRKPSASKVAFLCSGMLTSDPEILPFWVMVSPDVSNPVAQLKLLTQQIYLGLPRPRAIGLLQSQLISMCDQRLGDFDTNTKICEELNILRKVLNVRFRLSGDARDLNLFCSSHAGVKDGRFEAKLANDGQKRLYARVSFPSLVVVDNEDSPLSALQVPSTSVKDLRINFERNIEQTVGAVTGILASIDASALPDSAREKIIADFRERLTSAFTR